MAFPENWFHMKARLHTPAVLTVSRKVLRHKKVVYLLVANRPIRYRRGKSRIAYIGTTSKGIARVATSVAFRAQAILSGYGLSNMEVYVVTCPPQRRIRSWVLLERALICQFVQYFWQAPKCNAQGKNLRWTPKLGRYFNKRGIDAILTKFDG
jgi:hypothetical protein